MPAMRPVGTKNLVGTLILTAQELADVMEPFLEPDAEGEPFRVGESPDCYPFATLVEQTLERAGMTSTDLDLVVLHGGSCHSPFLRRLFEDMRLMGLLKRDCKVCRTPDLTTSVARGAALYGCLSAKHGKPYVPPIVPEDLSILTEGGKYEVLLSAGTQLPVAKTFAGARQFYLSQDGQREITLPITIGYEDRRRASTLTIPIQQKRLGKSHPVEVELTIDADKISRWRCRPAGFAWCDAIDMANPWTGQEPTPEAEELRVHREAIRASLERGLKPPASVLWQEALVAAKSGMIEEGLELAESLIEDQPDSASAWNVKGLILGIRGDAEGESECFGKAAEVAPDKPVFRGNYGVSLHRIKKHAQAVEVMRDALSRDQNLTYLHSWLADAFLALGDLAQVQAELERWHAHARRTAIQDPDDAETWGELVVIATRLGRYDEAEEARNRIRELTRDRNLLAGPGHG